MGGEAVANGDDVSDYDGRRPPRSQAAIDTFGGLDVLVNNAGILRDRMLVNMTTEEWDAVIRVHLRGTFAPTRHAAEYWREPVEGGRDQRRPHHQHDARRRASTATSARRTTARPRPASPPSRSSPPWSSAATASPSTPSRRARSTRMTEDVGLGDRSAARKPERVRPRSTRPTSPPWSCGWGAPSRPEITGRVFNVAGGDQISVAEGWQAGPGVDKGDRWDSAELGEIVPDLVAKAARNANMAGRRK